MLNERNGMKNVCQDEGWYPARISINDRYFFKLNCKRN